MRDIAPDDQWPQAAQLLAQLQSIKRVELSHAAAVTASAFDLVNAVRVAPAAAAEGDAEVERTSGSGGSDGEAQGEGRRRRWRPWSGDSGEERDEVHALDRAGTAPRRGGRRRSGGHRGAAPGETTTSTSGDAAPEHSDARPPEGSRAAAAAAAPPDAGAPAATGHVSLESWPCATADLQALRALQRAAERGPLSAAQAAHLDALFMRRLMALAGEAHFAGARPL